MHLLQHYRMLMSNFNVINRLVPLLIILVFNLWNKTQSIGTNLMSWVSDWWHNLAFRWKLTAKVLTCKLLCSRARCLNFWHLANRTSDVTFDPKVYSWHIFGMHQLQWNLISPTLEHFPPFRLEHDDPISRRLCRLFL